MIEPTHILCVLTPDSKGIIHSIVETLKHDNARHLEISQTILHGMFTITVVLQIPAGTEGSAVADRLQGNLGSRASVSVQPYTPVPSATVNSERYILTAIGSAVPGVLQAITGIILDRGGNFTDFSSKVIDQRLQLLAEVDLPADSPLDQLQIDLRHACEVPDLQVRLHHSRLFQATNDVAFRRTLHA